jgi:hypothetical protein
MGQTFWEKWRHRITGAWAVLTGQAFAGYYFDDCMKKYWTPDLSNLPSHTDWQRSDWEGI